MAAIDVIAVLLQNPPLLRELGLLALTFILAYALYKFIMYQYLISQNHTRGELARYITFRIRSIPLNLSREMFENDLKSIASSDPVLRQVMTTLGQVTLVRMNKESACATATVYTTISSWELVRRLQEAHQECCYQFDSEFYGITPLYVHDDAHVDLIAVPGLGGHAVDTWKSSSSNQMWLRDFVPKDLPNCRILIYGYDTNVEGGQSKQSIEDLGSRFMETATIFRADTQTSQRPIIFIGHGLGGVLIKEALIHARLSRSESNLQIACYGIFFFGASNLGLRREQLLTIAREKPNQALTGSLVVDRDSEPSAYLRRILDDFSRNFERKYVIVNFHERNYTQTVPVNQNGTRSRIGKACLMVRKESATKTGAAPVKKEDNISLDTDHSKLVKYDSRNHQHYTIVRGRLSKNFERARIVVAQRFYDESPYQPTPNSITHCLKSLAFEDMEKRYNDISTALDKTCEWIYKEKSFKDWCSKPSDLLWIKGRTGSGKSTLMKYALNQTKTAATESDITLYFFFHDGGNKLQKTLEGCYRSILYQLLRRFPAALFDLIEKFAEQKSTIGPPGRSWKWHLEDLQDFLKKSLRCILKAFSIILFVDALDECGEENAIKLVDYFKTMQNEFGQNDSSFKICISSRHYPALHSCYASETIIVERRNKGDIERYVNRSLSSLQGHRENYVSLITERAAGIFLWAHLVAEQVLRLERNGTSENAIKIEIGRIPQDLSELYERLIKDVKEPELGATIKLMRWICFAERPLSTNELRWAMAIDPDGRYKTLEECRDSPDFIEDDKIDIRVRVLSCGFAEVTQSKKPIVRFIHKSAKEFIIESGLAILTKERLDSFPVDYPSRVAEQANYSLLRSCMQYLAVKELEEADTVMERFRHIFSKYVRYTSWPGEKFPFFSYAVSSWVYHAKKTEGVTDDYLLALFSWPGTEAVERLLRLSQYDNWLDWPSTEGTTLLHVASYYGLTNTISTIVSKLGVGNKGIDATDCIKNTPLMIATRAQEIKAAKLLLEAKANVDYPDNANRTPLWWAAGRNSEDMVRLLIQYGAAVDLPANNGRTALHESVRTGQEIVTKLLLDHGAKVDSPDGIGRTPLFEADTVAILKLLLDCGAEIDFRDANGQTPLTRALDNDGIARSKLFLDHGADVNSKGPGGRTPLFLAIEIGKNDVVKLLLDHGADVNSKDNTGKTPLFFALEKDKNDAVRILLDHNAELGHENANS